MSVWIIVALISFFTAHAATCILMPDAVGYGNRMVAAGFTMVAGIMLALMIALRCITGE